MNAAQTAIARDCFDAAHDGTLAFPAIAARLIAAGFEGYAVDYRSNGQTYYTADGGIAAFAMARSERPVGDVFDNAGIGKLVRWAQANGPDYSYAAFCEKVKDAGCAGYLVSFPGRRVVYYGRTGEIHTEHFPQ